MEIIRALKSLILKFKFIRRLAFIISLRHYFEPRLLEVVVAGNMREAALYLSAKPEEAANVFGCAYLYNSLFNNERSDILKMSAWFVENFAEIRVAFIENAVNNRDVDTSIELVDSGVLDGCGDIEQLLVELCEAYSCHPEIEHLVATIIRRCRPVDYAVVLHQLNYFPLLSRRDGPGGVHSALRIMHKNGCNFGGGSPVNPKTFFYSYNYSHGLISDLIEWGVCVERPSRDCNDDESSDDVRYINSEIDEGERRIAERDAANITQALADAGLTQSEDSKPKRRM
ncbi:hypothetical protein [Stenotrophomonas maltophilia]|uniref:hypothetical protein n=1 Tax=Stenotrophomonas maltophilia TaxID=40324 RepID=UPI0015E01E06|nr:hypothetical protein [Stenotrophomonas maltophilia]